MRARPTIAIAALLVSSAAIAQTQAPNELNTDELLCQLSDDCVDPPPDPPPSEGGPAQGDERTGSSRGFAIEKKSTVANPARARMAASAAKSKTVAGPDRADLRVSFITGSSELTAAGRREAQNLAEALKSPVLAGKRFRIEGHTDAVGSRESNLELSRRRAAAVVDFLVDQGAERARFEIVGFGFDKPLRGMDARAAANRRVEVVMIP